MKVVQHNRKTRGNLVVIIDNTHPLVMMHDKLMLAFEPKKKKKNEEEKKVHKCCKSLSG